MEHNRMYAEPQKLLEYVEEGMTVFDRLGKRIGKVKMAYHGANSLFYGEQAPLVTDVDETLVPEDVRASLPPERVGAMMRQKLFRTGFLKIHTGLLTADRYVLPDQIQSVTGDHIFLSVDKDETLKF